MGLMHYDIHLPGDHNMETIRERVRTRGHALDQLPGLTFKAYLLRESGKAGSTVNSYSPFYLWHSEHAMREFLLGPGFAGLSQDFGRPSVEHWMEMQFQKGKVFGKSPVWATLLRIPIAAGKDLSEAIHEAENQLNALQDHPALHCAVSGLDLRTWEQVLFALWTTDPSEQMGIHFQVLHLSCPGLEQEKV
ncbi:DUF4865 family protein [Deinococcus roseus]|uniref:DUF4865 domain-containing protein n=1 Tax=Deinococcus roseus TaxID=392414 RepID=A0ABQ2CXP3_9DEIO|nr:DUF4865 family protein [Deinococcus roseus]GGJ31198.1 DUF4865 domain-containing protein [Deinococcus roseus]